jgi:hypothetical protein
MRETERHIAFVGTKLLRRLAAFSTNFMTVCFCCELQRQLIDNEQSTSKNIIMGRVESRFEESLGISAEPLHPKAIPGITEESIN